MSTSSRTPWLPDRPRQALNLALALAQPITTILCFAMGTSFEVATRSDVAEPPIIPAGYTFTIWTLIYAGAIAYGVYQARPARRADPLLRRIGLPTASAFLGTSAWLVMARFGLTWLTVVCIVWMMASLAIVLRLFVREGAPRTAVERWFVVAPLSLFAGYVTAATFANTAAALKGSAWMAPGKSETAWSVAMLVAAGSIAAWVTLATRGNVAYATAIIWALVGVVVANTIERAENLPVAIAAGSMALGVAAALTWARFAARRLITARG
jgi:benzodiazapine receptor